MVSCSGNRLLYVIRDTRVRMSGEEERREK